MNKVYWSQLTQIVYDDFIHPGKVLIGIKALATDQLNGNDPNVTWIQERKTVWVFNTYTGAYESKPANNPAWACYDILHHCRKIGDEYVVKGAPRERFVYDAFKAWADKCDEKHITFNYIYDNASQVWDALKYAENVGRGKVIPLGTRFSCIWVISRWTLLWKSSKLHHLGQTLSRYHSSIKLKTMSVTYSLYLVKNMT